MKDLKDKVFEQYVNRQVDTIACNVFQYLRYASGKSDVTLTDDAYRGLESRIKFHIERLLNGDYLLPAELGGEDSYEYGEWVKKVHERA